MLIKKTARNQVTLPKSLLGKLAPTDYFEAEVAGDVLVLRPVKVVEMVDIDKVRDRLRRRRVKAAEVEKAVSWARENK
ncbi:AbrB/MazE/SpoVT family DNA-binding domain-containing protein [candidate division WOR-3 bacterium]|nr:AbrB/MazE/SpoVT family DNA-binding domain-containing protein [candidate division WOR-3 bacterium]